MDSVGTHMAFLKGQRDRQAGRQITDCPYTDIILKAAWNEGWRDEDQGISDLESIQ